MSYPLVKNGNRCVWIGIGVNVTPREKEYRDFLKINELLASKYGSTYKFDPVFRQPHLNLYDIDVPFVKLEMVKSKLQQVVNDFRSFSVKLSGITCFEHGTILVNCELDENLKLLDYRIVEEISPLRGNCRTNDYWKPGRAYSRTQRECREKYGNPFVAEAFYPHISLGFLKTKKQTLNRVTWEANRGFRLRQLGVRHLDLVVHDEKERLLETRSYSL